MTAGMTGGWDRKAFYRMRKERYYEKKLFKERDYGTGEG